MAEPKPNLAGLSIKKFFCLQYFLKFYLYYLRKGHLQSEYRHFFHIYVSHLIKALNSPLLYMYK